MTSQGKWLYGLTADEWLHLASEGEASEVAPCCGNIGAIRDTLRQLLGFQSPDDIGWRISLGRQLLEELDADGDEHGLRDVKSFPLLHRVLTGVRTELVLGALACQACAEGRHADCAAGPDGRRICTCTAPEH